MKQCMFFWNGVECEGSSEFTLQPGASPSRGTLHFRLGYQVAQFGTLRITDGSRSINLADCRMVRIAPQSVGNGRMQEFTVEDRRWRWQYSRIWGNYNYRPGALLSVSARRLAVLLMEALGEKRYNVTAIPDDAFPAIEWSSDLAAEALESLCSQFGCVIVPKINGSVFIERDGSGRLPPRDALLDDWQQSAEPPIVPDQLVFEGGNTLWQQDFLLEAVGVEDMTSYAAVKPINSLSYKPTAGWGGEDPKYFGGVAAAKRDLAKSCIFRMYRIVENTQLKVPPSQVPNGRSSSLPQKAKQQIADYYKIKTGELWRILPITTKQVAIAGDPATKIGQDAKVLGWFANQKLGNDNNDTLTAWAYEPSTSFPRSPDDKYVYPGSFSIDVDTGIVRFSDPVYFWTRTSNTNRSKVPAVLRLRTSVGLRDRDTGAWLSQQYWYKPPRTSRAGVTELVKRDDAVFEILNVSSNSTTTNVQEWINQATLYLEEALSKYYVDTAVSAQYIGFRFDIELSGAIRAVTWSVADGGGGTTAVEYLNERPDLRLSPKELRDRLAMVAAVRQTKRARSQAAINALRNGAKPVQ